jgi:BirA family biotin operon repressor/biotin-[acetyl-CoA-carboxylase] ligase
MKRLPANEAALEKILKAGKLPFNVEWYDTHRSTNKRARDIGSLEKKKPCVIIANAQTEGRGRLGRTWHSPDGEGLWFSIVCFPEMSLQKVTTLTVKTGKAVQRFLGREFNIDAAIKYPNDLLVDGKKICGILAESDTIAGKNTPEFVVLGTGINLKTTFPDDLKEICTSVKDHWKGTFRSNELLIADVVAEIVRECELKL